jgi:hypothetical protein
MGTATQEAEGVGSDPTQDKKEEAEEGGEGGEKTEGTVEGGDAAEPEGTAEGDDHPGDVNGDDAAADVNGDDAAADVNGDDGDAANAANNARTTGGEQDVKEDDVKFNDSISNVRSQPGEKAKSGKDVKFLGGPGDNTLQTSMAPTPRPKRSNRKGIFVSYSPDAGFLERRFVVEMVRQLKENNLAEDLWFDKDEKNTDSPCWFSLCMEAVEKCRAAILVLSDSYFSCPVSVYEGRVLLERQISDPSSIKLFSILFSQVENAEIPKQYISIMNSAVDLTGENQAKKSAAEKTSIVIGAIMEQLEKFATVNAPPVPVTPPDNDFTGEYKRKKICNWNAADLQEWLFSLGIKEFYRQVRLYCVCVGVCVCVCLCVCVSVCVFCLAYLS